jgi:hypothetical protein
MIALLLAAAGQDIHTKLACIGEPAVRL